MQKPKIQRKMGLKGENGNWQIRVSHKKQKGKKSPSYTFMCGCCSEKVTIFYDDEALEINGVNGSIKNWRELLLSLLGINK